jgi:FHS family L-fucose permease-like MFS transporter
MANEGKEGVTTKMAAPGAKQSYALPLTLITSLFFLWALGVNLNDVLIPRFKAAFGLTDFQSSFIQIAFFGGYFLAAFPAGKLMERIGYQKGILTGLLLCATGALLFLPAASVRTYGFFLFALFVMACGQSFLEVAANPYVTFLGPPETAERRLNFAQSFNAVGSVAAPFIGAAFILTGVEYSSDQLAAMSPSQVQAYRIAEAGTVKVPYLVIAGVFIAYAAVIFFAHLPKIQERRLGSESGAGLGTARGLFSHAHLVKGVVAQFFYVGAQVGVASFVIRFAQHTVHDMTAHSAATYLKLHAIGFMIGRFAGSALMKHIRASRLLAVFAAGCLVCIIIALTTAGIVPVWAIVLIGFFHSIMFPTIFALSIKNLGPYTERGSSFLVMAIIGGAFFPAVMGRISDLSNIQRAFIVPLICYAYILYFALSGYKPDAGEPAGTAIAEIEAA